MKRVALVSVFLLVASTVFCVTHAQDQSTPVGLSEVNADYPSNRAGIFIQDKEWTAVGAQTPTKTKLGHGLAASLSYGIAPAKLIAEYAGEHASAQAPAGRPVVCICHMISLPGDPVLVRLHPKKGIRELDGGRMTVYPVVGNAKMVDANKSDLIPVNVSHVEPQVWLVRPQFSLDPGEYALMLGTQNVAIYPFSVVAPPAQPVAAN